MPEVFDYTESLYNSKRWHSFIGKLSPNAFFSFK